jgi:hypothetical protein
LVEALAASLSIGSWSWESTSEWTSSVESLWWGSSVGGWSTKTTTESELWGSKSCSDDSEENNEEFHDFWLKENFRLIKPPNLHRFLYLSTLKLCEEKTREKHFMPLVHLVMLRRRKTLIFLVECEVVDNNSQKRGEDLGKFELVLTLAWRSWKLSDGVMLLIGLMNWHEIEVCKKIGSRFERWKPQYI